MLASIAVALALASPLMLDVPYLPQSDALCGGAAAAMVFRYWGDTHASVQEFAALVDRRGGVRAALGAVTFLGAPRSSRRQRHCDVRPFGAARGRPELVERRLRPNISVRRVFNPTTQCMRRASRSRDCRHRSPRTLGR